MTPEKLPAIQFYVGDWRKDVGVQSLDFYDRGVWFEVLCLMHESDQRGRMVLNGQPMPDPAISRVLGVPLDRWKEVKSRLLDYGVADLDEDGALINRRMVKDEEIRQKRAAAGRKGGKKSRPPQKEAKTKQTGSKQGSKRESRKSKGDNEKESGQASGAEANEKQNRTSSVSTSVSTAVKEEPSSLRSDGNSKAMKADELLGKWIDLQPERPPSKVVSKQGAAAARICSSMNRKEIDRAIDGIGRLYPHSEDEPWDLFDLEKKAAKALAAGKTADEEPESQFRKDSRVLNDEEFEAMYGSGASG